MAESLFHEASRRLQDAIKEKNIGEMTVVHGPLQVANAKMKVARKKLEECRHEKEVLATKRRKLMDHLTTK